MFSPRWRKVVRDIGVNKTRTVLVVLSIAVGVFVVGLVTQTFSLVNDVLAETFTKTNFASATLTTDKFDDQLVETVRRMPGVEAAEGRSIAAVKVKVGDEWKSLLLYAIPDYGHVQINRIFRQGAYAAAAEFGAEDGVWPPPEHGVLLERSSLLIPGLVPAGLKVGNDMLIETNDGKQRMLRAAGLVSDPGNLPATFMNMAYGYITLDTLEWLTGSRGMNQLNILVSGDKLDKKHVTEVAESVRNKIENSGRQVGSMSVPEPGRHPLQDLFQALLLLLNALGLLALFLSAFLIVNTIAALLSQQVRQIGIMKAIGARRRQVVGMYTVMVLIYGGLAFLVAAPLAMLSSRRLVGYLAGFVNLDMPAFRVLPVVIALMAGISLIVPLVAAVVPVFMGTRVTVREAITEYGLGRGRYGTNIIDRLLEHVRGVSRPMLISLRNTFRRKTRLLLTLSALVLGGAIFITVFSVRASMLLTLDDALKNFGMDIILPLNRPYRTEVIAREALAVPGVTSVETWGYGSLRRVRADNSESESIDIMAPPARTAMLDPTIIAGRWLLPEDENAIVLSTDVLKQEKDIKLGDDITLKVRGKDETFRVVGLARVVGRFGSGIGLGYVNLPYYERMMGEVGRAGSLQVTTDRHDVAYQERVKKSVEEHFKSLGIKVSAGGITSGQIRSSNELFFNIIVALLMVMAVLMAVVGGLGLAGTMSLNVLERMREIGVLRAVGASDGAVERIVMVEGILIGGLSGVAGAVLAYIMGRLLSDLLGNLLFQMPLSYAFSWTGVAAWLVLVVILAAVASFLPARNAARLTVREVLAYQ
ncbi:MAG: FtsX-like permease family protein [Anaerolineae bacterium]